ncbi:hypothetical protein C1646_765018 [Rhizophagus diaphanus]|nr:hypothetical protein C1646_765018 [Rhizophagus diaphanus] [Rhizophagus sp. MUCL 43196]
MEMAVNIDDDPKLTEAKEANEKEKEWWSSENSLGYLDVGEERLPLILARGVTFKQFQKRVEKIKARRFFSFQDGTVMLIELPNPDHEAANTFFSSQFTSSTQQVDNWGAAKLYPQGQGHYEEPDACFVPISLQPRRNSMKKDEFIEFINFSGRPWPTIILEVASTESLVHAINKVNNHWFLPNCAEDVIIIKLGSWRNQRYNNQLPLRRLRCLKFCRTASLRQNLNTTRFDPIEEIEFGSVYSNGREASFCTGPHMKWITIDCSCIYSGCQPPILSFNAVVSSAPLPANSPSPLQRPGVAIDLYDIQQAIFRATV